MNPRPYDAERDREHCTRIWSECGWNDGSDNHKKAQDVWLETAESWVGGPGDEAECLVGMVQATMRIQDGDVPLSIVGAVTTSRVARKLGIASRLTAHALATHVAENGSTVAILGMFEQGFYDQLGFSTGPYEHFLAFAPRQLLVPGAKRPPVRLGLDDFEEMHACRMRRRRTHGAVTAGRPGFTREQMLMTTGGFGLGFRDEAGTLTHHFWSNSKGETGPYHVCWFAWETREQLLELLGLLRNLGDQVRMIQVPEPAGIQLHKIIERPVHHRIITRGGTYEQQTKAFAWWQARICDVPAYAGALSLPWMDLRFNVRVSDPVQTLLPDDAPWRGVAGDWTVSLGAECTAAAGADESLPTLECDVGTLTRLLLGVLPASGLAVSDELAAPDDLIAALDGLRIPSPAVDWDF